MVEIRFTSHHFSPRYAYSFTDLAVKTSRPLKIGYLKTYSVCKSMKMKPIYHLCILSKSTNFEENNVHEIWHHQRTKKSTRQKGGVPLILLDIIRLQGTVIGIARVTHQRLVDGVVFA